MDNMENNTTTENIKNIRKPITVAKMEFDQKLEQLINSTIEQNEIPGFVMLQTFQTITEFLKNFSERQYNNDLQNYQKLLEESKQ